MSLISEVGKQTHSLKQYLAIDEKVLGKQVKETGLAIHRTIQAKMEEYYSLVATLPEDQAQPLILGLSPALIFIPFISSSKTILISLFNSL